MSGPQDRSQFAQPEMPIPAPVRPAKSRTSRYIRPVVALLVVAAIAFGGGYAFANATSTRSAAARGNGQFGNGQFGPGASPGAGRPRGGFGGGASGTVSAVAPDQMTITTASGAQELVLLTSTTKVTEVTSATKALSDIANGTTVTIVGTTNQDGSVTATQVIIGNAGVFGRGLGGGETPAPSGAP